MKINLDMDTENAAIIRDLLSIWDIEYSNPDVSIVSIIFDTIKSENLGKKIVIPSVSPTFFRWSKRQSLDTVSKPGKQISVNATPNLDLYFTPRTIYSYDKSTSEGLSDTILLNVDVIDEYRQILQCTLAAKSSLKYRMFTSVPIPYNIAPKRLRAFVMRQKNLPKNFNIRNVLPIDALRLILAKSIEDISKQKLARKTWKNRKSAVTLTHDVETRTGLLKTTKIKKLEEKYSLPSAWFIPSHNYSLDKNVVTTLANNGEVGSHDTKHDGKLFHLSENALGKRLLSSKERLETISDKPVIGFRAPLLQHSRSILKHLKSCGYLYDSSIPTWEAMHPRTMCPHGIGTVFPITIEGLQEIPITIMQDHQFLHVMKYTPKETIAEWLSEVSVIKELGGSCVFLSHPEYSILNEPDLSLYEEFLSVIASDNDMSATLPKEMIKQ